VRVEGARRLARQFSRPQKPGTKICLRGLAPELVLLRWLAQGIMGASAAQKRVSFLSVAERLCAHCRAHWLGGWGVCLRLLKSNRIDFDPHRNMQIPH